MTKLKISLSLLPIFLFFSVSLGQTVSFSFKDSDNICLNNGGQTNVEITISSSGRPSNWEHKIYQTGNPTPILLGNDTDGQFTITNVGQTSTYFVTLFDKDAKKDIATSSNKTFTVNHPSTLTLTADKSDVCITGGTGTINFNVSSLVGATNSKFYVVITGGGDDNDFEVTTTNPPLTGGNFVHTPTGKSDNETTEYYVKTTESNGCIARSNNRSITFHAGPNVTEKGTASTPILNIVKYSQGSYSFINDVFDNPNNGIQWHFSPSPTLSPAENQLITNGVKQMGNWVLLPKAFQKSGYIIDDAIDYTATLNTCTVSGTIKYTDFKIIDDNATLPDYLKCLAPLPICQNGGSYPMVASIKKDCAPAGTISIVVNYYNGLSVSSKSLTGKYGGEDEYSDNNLYSFEFDPGLYPADSIYIKIATSCSPIPNYNKKVPFLPANTPTLLGVTDVFIENNSRVKHYCSASLDTVIMRANPSGGQYTFHACRYNGTKYADSAVINSTDFTYKGFVADLNDPTYMPFVPSELYEKHIKSKNDDDNWAVRVRYISPQPCPDTLDTYFVFTPHVDTTFSFAQDTICLGDKIQFTVNPASTSSIFSWEFGDGGKTGITGGQASHDYKNPGFYKVRFQTHDASLSSNKCNNDVLDSIWVGTRPEASFDIARHYYNIESILHSNSTIPPAVANPIPGDTIFQWIWDIETYTPFTASDADTAHTFTAFRKDPYKVMHIAKTTWGCTDTAVRYIPVFPIYTPTMSNAELDHFDQADVRGWYESGQYDTIAKASSWRNETPAGSIIKSYPDNGGDAWITSENKNTPTGENNLYRVGYYDEEQSWVESPIYNISQLELPMVSLNTITNTDLFFDGVTLQYTFCDSVAFGKENWITLGNESQGLNWYTSSSIVGNPGGVGNLKGWTGDTARHWKLSAYRLNELQPYLIPQGPNQWIRFRIALGTNKDNNPKKNFEGFAFDNFSVGQRNRKVLVEEFCDYQKFEPNLNADFKDPAAIRLQYHVASFTSQDDLNKENPADPSARALLYGIGKALPRGVIDGIYYNNEDSLKNWGPDAFLRRSLMVSPFDITVTPSIVNNKVQITGKVHKTSPENIPGPFVLQFAVVEKSVSGNNNIKFTNVLRSLVPNAAGHRIRAGFDWNNNDTSVTVSWSPFRAPEDTLMLVVFLQDENTKEVYQTNYDILPYDQVKNLPVVKKTGSYNPIVPVSVDDVYLSPNPTSGELKVVFNGITMDNYKWTVLDNTGRALKSDKLVKGINAAFLDMSDLTTGFYYLQIEGEGQRMVKKFSLVK